MCAIVLRIAFVQNALRNRKLLINKKTFNNLVKYVTEKSKNLCYWSSSKKAISTKVRRNFKASPKKTVPQRKLSVKEELTFVLLKLRTAITNEMLADLFDISNDRACL